MRGAIYVGGFNLYHAISDLGMPHLKWLDLHRLGSLIARGHARTLERAVFCTAYFPGDHGKRVRHEAYINALKNVGVEVKLGHTTKETMECKHPNCGHRWDAPREKETDINLALAVIDDAYQDRFDMAFVVTADTDQAATFRMMRDRFPEKRIVTVVPPDRSPSKHLNDLAYRKINLTVEHLDSCVFPALVQSEGQRTIPRPREYAPPEGWIHPDERPARR